MQKGEEKVSLNGAWGPGGPWERAQWAGETSMLTVGVSRKAGLGLFEGENGRLEYELLDWEHSQMSGLCFPTFLGFAEKRELP